MKKTLLTLATAVLCSGSAFASGFQVLLQSNRSTAMGNIGVGLRPDPSAINFNPGSLAMMRGNGVQIGANLIYSKVLYRPAGSTNDYVTDNPTGTPFHVFATFGADESPLKFGLGVYTPFGSTVQWEDGWPGQFQLTQLELRAIYIQPTVSYRISEKVSVGAGLIYSFGGVNLQRNIDVPFTDGSYSSAELDGSASGWGYNLGVYFEPNETFSFGLNYRSKIDMKVDDGEATFTAPGVAYQNGIVPPETSFEATLPLPSTLTFGAVVRPMTNFQFGVDVGYASWSAYEELRFDYADPVRGENSTVEPRNYEDSWVFRFGTEYGLNEMIKLRAGAYYDQTPVQDGFMTPETPDADAIGLTGGFGLNVSEKLTIDGSFLYIDKEQRDNPEIQTAENLPIGTYKTKAFIPGISLTYNF